MGTDRAGVYASEMDHQRHIERESRATDAKIEAQEKFNEKVLKVSKDGDLPQMTQDAKDMWMVEAKGMKAIANNAANFMDVVQVLKDVVADLTTSQRWEKTQKAKKFAIGLIGPNEVNMHVEIQKHGDGSLSFTVSPVTQAQLKEYKPNQPVDLTGAATKSAMGNAPHRENPPEEFDVKSPNTNPDKCTFNNPDGRTDGKGGVIRAESVYRERERMLNEAFGDSCRAPDPSNGIPEPGSHRPRFDLPNKG